VQSKQVRRRRAILAVLVGLSLILLTAYFGEPSTSPLHTLQRGIAEVFSPIQEGASKVFSPVRDVAGWFSDTIHAKSRASELQKRVDELQAEVAQYRSAALLNGQLSREVGLDQADNIQSYTRVTADVIWQDPTLWYQQIEVDKGSDDGVRVDDAVIGDGALVGKVAYVGATYAIVSLITDHTVNVAAQVTDQNGDRGLIVPDVGNNPNELVLEDLPQLQPGQPGPQLGQQVLTAGFKSGGLTSLYPRGILIGTVSNADANALYNNQQVQVSPAADLRHLQVVQILTRPQSSTVRAQLP
jgi:rod shape-determining protein MreC